MSALAPSPASGAVLARDSAAPSAPLPGVRVWFLLFLAWMGGLALLAQRMFAAYDAGDGTAMGLWLLALMCFYLSLCNIFLPLPTTWIVFLLASPEAELFESPAARVATVALAGAAATTMANLNEYHILGWFTQRGLGDRIRRTQVYAWAIRWFDAAPFTSLAAVGFLPIPIDAVRWLAILRRYPRARFAAAYFVGRGARYVIFAWLSVVLMLHWWQIALIQVALILLALMRVVMERLRRGRTSEPVAGATAGS